MKPRVHLNEIRFFIDPQSTPDDIQLLFDLIATIIYVKYGSGAAVKKPDDEGGYRWNLGYRYGINGIVDLPNDWHADIGANGDAPNEVVVSYRYGLTKETAEKMSKLRDTIIWLLDLERFNPEETTD